MTNKSDSLPAVTGATGKPPAVAVDLEPVISDEEMDELLARDGNIRLSSKTLKHLKQVGIKVKGLGVTHIQRGAVMVDQARCDEVLDMLRTALANRIGEKERPQGLVKEATAIALGFAAVMGKKTDIARLALEIEQAVAPGGSPVEERQPAIPNFTPGKPIVPAVPPGGTLVIGQTVNLSGGEPKGPKGG